MSRDILDNSESYEEGLFRTIGTFARELGVSGVLTPFMMMAQEQDEDKQLECESLKLEEAEETDCEILE